MNKLLPQKVPTHNGINLLVTNIKSMTCLPFVQLRHKNMIRMELYVKTYWNHKRISYRR